MKKRGQAAAFIIIGLVILVIAIGFVAVKKGVINSLLDKISTERRSVPQQIKPMEEFIESCVAQVTQEGVSILAEQGGYINLPSDQISTTDFSPLGSALEIIPNSNLKTSVWYRERGNGIQELNLPSKSQIENELADYVTVNFPQCLSNLTSFADQGFLIEAEDVPNTKIIIADSTVLADVDFPIKVTILSTETTLSKHSAKIDSNLGKLYKMAKEIMTEENNESFLEQKTIDMLVAYNEEVPFSGTDLSCTEKTWVKSEVEAKLKNIISENVAAMKVKGTKYTLNNADLKYLEFDPLSTKDSSVTANFMYSSEWPTLIEITPSEGNLLRSDSVSRNSGNLASTIATFFCLNTYRFVYDIKYPVLITLTDENDLSFQFATQIIIDNNQPKENKLELLDVPDVASPICQYPQKEVTIFTGVIDKNDELQPLEDVSLSFKCFPASCPLGKSELDNNGEPTLTTKVPLCFNGVIEGAKEGYKQIQKSFYSSNDPDTEPIALVTLEPLYKKKVNIFVIDKETREVRPPHSTEQINFQFAHTRTSYEISYIYPNEEENSEIEILPGEYKINSYILREASNYKITFPKTEVEKCIDTRDFGLFSFFQSRQVCNSIETEPVEFDNILTGGATDISYEFTREDLASDKEINLYILSSKIPSNAEELQKIQIEIETNKDHPLFRNADIK